MKKQRKSAPAKAAAPPAPRAVPTWTAPALIALAVLIFYWTPLTSSTASIQWDAADMHLPLQRYFSDHIRAGALPFWTPYLFSGYPLLANPEVGAWYVPHWIFFLLGITPRAIQMELALQTLLACLGAYFLLSRLVASRAAAVIGAFAYGLSGFFAGHSSHIGLFSAAACFPWLLLAYRRAVDGAALRYAALGGIVGGLMILAGYFQTALYGFLGLGLFALADLWRDRARGSRRQLRTVAIVAGMLAGALAVAAVQILPGIELNANSIRSAAHYSKNTDGVLQARPLLTLLFPDALGAVSGKYTGPADITQYYFYAGLLLLPLAIAGLFRAGLRLPALCIAIPALWYMAGPSAGLYKLGAWIPGLHKVRAPIQGWFLVALSFALLAAAGSEWILERWRWRYLAILLPALLYFDALYWNSIRNPLAYAHSSFAELYGDREDVARLHIAAVQPPLSRFDAPRRLTFLGPLDHPLDLQLESTYGYFALEPTLYDEYTDAMANNPRLRDGLNVSRILNLSAGRVDPNPAALPRAYFPKSVAAVKSLAESRQALPALDPSAQSIVLNPVASFRQDPAAQATVVSHDEQSYTVRYTAQSPSLLKLAVPWYPGWKATFGGKELPILQVDHALMGVLAPAGSGEIVFRFHSNYFMLGAALTLLGTLALLWVARPQLGHLPHQLS